MSRTDIRLVGNAVECDSVEAFESMLDYLAKDSPVPKAELDRRVTEFKEKVYRRALTQGN